uniref:OO_Ba0005L10-OO_Ba0081K17.2 protein n=1 Tax=Oryza officinalis TaxID=4535 RepID=D0ABC8_9ORYZ|nr:OO_Ba0005L10-OO_Ba0081K17.2 [Oryza officinalis]
MPLRFLCAPGPFVPPVPIAPRVMGKQDAAAVEQVDAAGVIVLPAQEIDDAVAMEQVVKQVDAAAIVMLVQDINAGTVEVKLT